MSTLDDQVPESTIRDFATHRGFHAIRCKDDSVWTRWSSNGVVELDYEAADASDQKYFSNKISGGDVLIAQWNNPRGFVMVYGIGIVSHQSEAQSSDERDKLSVNWAEVAHNGEALTREPPEDPPQAVVAPTDVEYFLEVLEGVAQEDFPPTVDRLCGQFLDFEESSDIEAVIDTHLPDVWRQSATKQRQITNVVRYFLKYTNPSRNTNDRRVRAQHVVSAAEGVEVNTVQSKCGRELWDDVVDGDKPRYHREHFDPAVEQIEEAVSEIQAEDSGTEESVEDAFNSDQLAQLLEEEATQAALYRHALAHLVAGKNLLFYGPPGTGKTRAANKLTERLCADERLVTANAEWSNQQVVGGYTPDGDGWTTSPGFLTTTARECQKSLNEDGKPTWLIIDELNRANLDQAFGEVFTLLDIDYRGDVPITYAEETQHVPFSFRIIGTMNTYDQAQLFSLGYAFRRRFAFVKVPSLLESQSPAAGGHESGLSSLSPTLNDHSAAVADLLTREVPGFFTGAASTNTAHDVAPLFPEFTEETRIEAAMDTLQAAEDLSYKDLDFLETLTYFAQEVTDREVVEIGQALLIDAGTFLLAHQLLFPDATTRETLDQAIVSYLVPQFEQFMSDLRRSETVDTDSDATERYNEIIDIAAKLELPQTAAVLVQARETKQILDS